MNAHSQARILVRTIGLVISLIWLRIAAWSVVQIFRSVFGLYPEFHQAATLAENVLCAGDVVVFAISLWMLLDGRMLIDHIAGVRSARKSAADSSVADSPAAGDASGPA